MFVPQSPTIGKEARATAGPPALHAGNMGSTRQDIAACSTARTGSTADLAPAGRHADPRQPAAPHRRFRDAGRSARLCRQGQPRHQFPRCARHAGCAPIPIPSCARMRSPTPAASSRWASSKGDRLALIAETGPEFAACFFGAIYAGAVAGAAAAADQLRRARRLCRPAGGHARPAATRAVPLSRRARRIRRPPRPRQRGVDGARLGQPRRGRARRRPSFPQPTATTSPICNIRAARPASRTASRSPTAPCSTISTRTASASRSATPTAASRWLPWYHDMGLVGCMLSPIANQISVDYLKTEDFARRPLAWLDLISRNPGTTLSYSPTFGYDICARRMSSQTRAADRFDLSRWRIAGNGADMIRPDVMQAFVDGFADAGFKASSLLPQLRPRRSDAGGLADAAGRRHPPRAGRGKRAVGRRHAGAGTPAPLPRDRQLRQAGQRHGSRDPRRRRRASSPTARSARSACRGTSRHGTAISATRNRPRACLGDDGWLDTGDMGYLSGGYIFIVGRAKDMIIINGKQPLAAGHRMGGRAAARLQVGRHRRLRHHRPVRRGNARGAGPLPRQRSRASAAACATTSASGSARSPASPRWSSWSRRAPCPAPARASCRGPRRATSICRGEIQPYDIAA